MLFRLIHRQGTLLNIAGAILFVLGAANSSAAADEPKQPAACKHQITGLFSKDREKDLRVLFAQLPEFKLVSIDFDQAEVVLEYDAAQVFPGAAPEQVIDRLGGKLRDASRSTFGVKPLPAVPQDQLERVEIPVVGLDCKACGLAAYEAIYRIDGVERATASFREGLVTAWIHPQRTNRAALEEALSRRGVELVKTP